MKEYVKKYIDQGFFVFPCNKDKTPATTHGFQDATCDPVITINQFWNDEFLIGFPCGKKNGIVVVDFDINKPFPNSTEIDTRTVEELHEAVENDYGKLPETLQIETPSGGRHYYYRLPDEFDGRIPPRSRFLDATLPVDIRGDDSYVIGIDETNYCVYDDVDELGIDNLISRCEILPEWIINYSKEHQSQTELQVIETALSENEVRELRSALSYIPADDRDTWVRMGMSLKSTNSSTSFGLWNEWSQKSEKYNPNDMEKRWKGFKPRNDLTIASIFYEAKKYGWITTYQDNSSNNVTVLSNNVITEDQQKKIEKIKEKTTKKPFPEHLLNPPGMVGEFKDYVLKSAFIPQPVFALGASLCAIGALAGRKYESQTRLRTNLYCLNVGGSGSGKDMPQKIIRDIFNESGCGTLACVDGISSDSAIETELQRENAQIFTLDEIGRFLQTTTKGASYLYNIVSVLLRVYSSANSIYWCKSYADKDRKKKIDQPHLCLLGSTVPDNLYGGLSYESATDGFLSRMLIFEADDDMPEEQEYDDMDFQSPQSLIDKIQYLNEKKINTVPVGNIDAVLHPRPQIVPMSEDAKDILRDFRHYIRKHRIKLKKENRIDAMYNRTVESSIKIAMILGIGIDPDNPIITDNEINYGIQLAHHLSDHVQFVIENHMAKNDHEHEVKNVYNIVCKAGQVSLAEISKQTQHLAGYLRDGIIQTLIDSDQIEERIMIENGTQKRMFFLK